MAQDFISSVFTKEALLVLEVSNTGDVISKEYKKEVFNRFKKVDKNSRARESVEGLRFGAKCI